MTRWLPVAEVARRLGLSTTTVHRLIDAGTIPAVRAGTGRGIYRITEAAVDAYAAERAT